MDVARFALDLVEVFSVVAVFLATVDFEVDLQGFLVTFYCLLDTLGVSFLFGLGDVGV